ncbi:U3 small nucleolar RNA-associated protein 6 homolog [Condylostylus longicornis]|uniref:U3 small nucleolar RNA-associated protein 6 homolog n=1 Tax=Condylostylus longicornis TaxID=2530218 RepID=UPI00244E1F13|nr:U3 small nucleolar RNA-associated protein 6 homolog [Condylostylus longicornis]
MAEFVSYSGEKLLPEYEYIRQKKLCSDEEIREIIKQRERMHFKTSKPSRTVNDFVEYIKFESSLLKRIKARESLSGPSRLQSSMANNIKNIYKIGLSYYPEKLKFWLEYIKFLKLQGYHFEVPGTYEKMLKFHGDKPYVWVEAAVFEYDEAHDIDRVKSIFFRGLQRHPDDIEMHFEFFKIMLFETSKMSTELTLQNNTQSEQSIGLERVEIIYKNAKKKITDIEYYIQVLATTELYPFTKGLQKMIISDMMSQFPLCEKIWHIFAQRELKGFSFSNLDKPDEEANIASQLSSEDQKDNARSLISFARSSAPGFEKKTLKQRIKCCVTMYRSAVREIKTEAMWNYYLNAMLELNQDLSTQKNYKREKLGSALKAAHEANFMSEYFYDLYIDLLKEDKVGPWDYLIEIMNSAVERYPQSIKLWEHLTTFYTIKDDATMVEESFRKAKDKLGSSSAKLYKILLQYYQTKPDCYDRLDSIYNEVCKETAEDFLNFRVDYLEYTALVKEDFELTRKLYDELTLLSPAVLTLHETMAYLESTQLKPNIARWRKCYENATNLFGKSSIQIWLNYLRFERDHGNPKQLTILFERAKQSLDAELVVNFVSDYQLFITGLI